MKKLLLASTALVLSAGLAHAQAVTISGEGRMGVGYESWNNGGSAWAQENRLQFNFTVSVTADHGLTFGAFSRARITNGATGVFSGSRVWVQANNLRLTFGNVDGAIRGAGTSHGYAGGCGVGYVGGVTCADAVGLIGVYSYGFPGTGVPGVVAPNVTMASPRPVAAPRRAFASTTRWATPVSPCRMTVAATPKSRLAPRSTPSPSRLATARSALTTSGRSRATITAVRGALA